MKSITYLVLTQLILILVFVTHTADVEGSMYYLEEGITPRSSVGLEKAILAGEVSHLRLASPGGAVHVAHRLAVLIREYDIDTYVGSDDFCSSACVILLAAGRKRHVEEGAKVGLHSAYYSQEGFLDKMKAPDLYRHAQESTASHLLKSLAFIESRYHLAFIRLQLHAHRNSTRKELYFATTQELKEAGIID